METTNCARHGEKETTIECIHIAQTADTGKRVGFFWSREDDQSFPDAWCKECNTKLLITDAWTKEMFEHASFKITCSECYKELRAQQTSEQGI